MSSAREELALGVLKALAHGGPIAFHDAIQLRKWAVRPEDAVLSLEEIARGILEQAGNRNAKTAEGGQ